MDQPLVISNSFDVTADCLGLVFTWNGYTESDTQKSILRFIESSSDDLRDQYLNFITSLGKSQNKNGRLSKYFEINEGPSLWWMSLLAEKSPYKSPRIIDCIRLMALERIVIIHQPKRVFLCLDDRLLADAIRLMCNRLGIDFSWQHKRNLTLSNVFSTDRFLSFFSKCTALIYLIYYFATRWTLRAPGLRNESSSKDSVFFASYLFNLDIESAEKGSYYSSQWGDLPELIHQSGGKTFHLEHFIKSPAIQNPKSAKRVMSLFDHSSAYRFHRFFDGPLSCQVFLKVVVDYFKLNRKYRELGNVSELFNVPNSKLNLWPILKNDWFCSFTGKTAVSNLILIDLFGRHMKEISFQKMGFYLCENMGWERALIKAWKNNNHGTLIAVPHSTIRFWDLRYFSTPDLNTHPSEVGLPLPDRYALNGEMARKALIQNGYPKEILSKVEALRYQFLEKHMNISPSNDPETVTNDKKVKRILVLGDFTKHQTDLMLKTLEALVKKFRFRAEYTLKPHPVCAIDILDYPLLKGAQTNKRLQDIVVDFDLVFSSNVTSASLDCFLMHKKVIVFLDGTDLNSSPLRGVAGVKFISNAEELYVAIETAEEVIETSRVNDFFWIDSEMSKWKKLISKLIRP